MMILAAVIAAACLTQANAFSLRGKGRVNTLLMSDKMVRLEEYLLFLGVFKTNTLHANPSLRPRQEAVQTR